MRMEYYVFTVGFIRSINMSCFFHFVVYVFQLTNMHASAKNLCDIQLSVSEGEGDRVGIGVIAYDGKITEQNFTVYRTSTQLLTIKGSVPPSVDHMEFVTWTKRMKSSELFHTLNTHENLLDSANFVHPNKKSAPTHYRLNVSLILHHYEQ